MRLFTIAVWTGFAVFGISLGNVFGASFMGLGDLPGGDYRSDATAVSANGKVVVGQSDSAPGQEGFRWTRSDGMVGLGDLPSGTFFSKVNGVSADGEVVVGSGNSVHGSEAFRWTRSSGMVGLGDLPGGTFFSNATGVSADGEVVVGFGSSDTGLIGEAFRWTPAGGMAGLGMLPGNQDYIPSKARGVSADGNTVVGFSGSVAGAQAFCWHPGDGLQGIGDLPGGTFSSEALAVSADGKVVVGFANSDQGQEAFRWTHSGGMMGLGTFDSGYFYSEAFDVSADGSVVVGYGLGERGQEAFIWDTGNGMRSLQQVLARDYDLELTGWALRMARAVSDDGLTIVGKGVNPDGNEEAWLVRLDEEMTSDDREKWFNEDDSFSPDQINEGELKFLLEPPQKPVLHSLNVLTVSQDSIENGWVLLEQCYKYLDPVPDAEVVYRYKSMRDLRVTSKRNIETVQLKGQSVQLTNITLKAELCVEAEVRIFYKNPNGTFSLLNGPFHRKFLDGYYPFHVTLKVNYPSSLLKPVQTKPEAQAGFNIKESENVILIDSFFEGMLNTEIIFQPVKKGDRFKNGVIYLQAYG